MIRTNSYLVYKEKVSKAFEELIKLCKTECFFPSDLLVCSFNGLLHNGKPMTGIGKEGYDSYQNYYISVLGIEYYTDNDNYFREVGSNVITDVSDFEESIKQEHSYYQMLWENHYLLRCLTQLAHILNSEPYDWQLDIEKEIDEMNGTVNYIIHIISRYKKAPQIQNILKKAYNTKIRNGIAHGRSQCVQGGIVFNNNDKSKRLCMTFEEWEEIYSLSYSILISIFEYFKDINQYYLNKVHNGEGDIYGIIRYPDGSYKSCKFLPIDVRPGDWECIINEEIKVYEYMGKIYYK